MYLLNFTKFYTYLPYHFILTNQNRFIKGRCKIKYEKF